MAAPTLSALSSPSWPPHTSPWAPRTLLCPLTRPEMEEATVPVRATWRITTGSPGIEGCE